LERELSGLEIDARLLAQKEYVLKLQKEEGLFEAALKEYDFTRGEIEHSKVRLKEKMDRLGPSWSEKKIHQFPLSIATGEEVRQFRDLLHSVEVEVEGKGERLAGMVTAKEETEERLQEFTLYEPLEQEELKQKKKACGEMRELIFRARALEKEWTQCEARLKDMEEGQALWEEKEEGRKWPPWVALAAGGAGVAAFVLFAFSRNWVWAVTGGGFWLIAILMELQRRWVEKQEKGVSKKKSEVRSSMVIKFNRLRDRKQELKKEVEGIEKAIGRFKDILSLEEEPSDAVLVSMEESLADQISIIERRREWERDLDRIKKRELAYGEDLREAEEKRESMKGGWQEWLKGRNLDPTLSPEGALESLSIIQACRNQLDQLTRRKAKEESLKHTIEDYRNLLSEVLFAWHGREIEEKDVQGAVRHLVRAYEETDRAAREEAVIRQELQRGRGALERLERQARSLVGEIDILFQSGNAENEERFRQRALEYEKGITLQRDLDQAEARLRELAFVSGGLDRIVECFSGASPEILEEKRLENEKKLKEAEAGLDGLKKEQATLEEKIRQLIQDDRMSILRAEEEELKASLEVLAEEWIAAAIGLRLIRQARARYEKERQPAVIREAGRYFRHITEGAYPMIIAPLGDHRVDVVDKAGGRKGPAQLSGGTVEQLYLSLRFGFIREFSKRSEPLPIMMDEILVNFDPNRARETARAIVELSQSHQILYFTCHPETVQLFKEEDNQIPVFEIEDGVIRTQ
jgi:uncharacterized protein YhaN